MVGPVQRSNTVMEAASLARTSSQVSAAQPTASPSMPELTEQVLNVMQTQGDTAEAMLQAEVSILKEALEIRRDMAGAVLQMLPPAQAFQAGVTPAASPGDTLNIVT